MSEGIVRFTVSVVIRQGRLEACEAVAESMVARSRRQPGTPGCHGYRSADRSPECNG